mmetsp:Transcript_43887/g.122012  ORF Transcript_43887/g.122012 Transcript_43887/m.122012 type:complete len:230 (+) Transcript_43887:1444-2133(+)
MGEAREALVPAVGVVQCCSHFLCVHHAAGPVEYRDGHLCGLRQRNLQSGRSHANRRRNPFPTLPAKQDPHDFGRRRPYQIRVHERRGAAGTEGQSQIPEAGEGRWPHDGRGHGDLPGAGLRRIGAGRCRRIHPWPAEREVPVKDGRPGHDALREQEDPDQADGLHAVHRSPLPAADERPQHRTARHAAPLFHGYHSQQRGTRHRHTLGAAAQPRNVNPRAKGAVLVSSS